MSKHSLADTFRTNTLSADSYRNYDKEAKIFAPLIEYEKHQVPETHAAKWTG